MKRLLAFLVVFGLGAAAPAEAASLKSLSKKIAKGLKKTENRKIAVLGFPYHDGAESRGSTIIQERMTTFLTGRGGVEVIERNLLEKVLGEMRLEATGMVDAKTTHELGRILGVGAIVTGTLNDLDGDTTEVNARLIHTETGRILAAGMAKVDRTWTDAPVRPRPPVVTDPRPPKNAGAAVVELAILLDTSNSMDGLIAQAKTQLWRIVNELASAEKEGESPALRVALYEYGNSNLGVREGYIRRVLPFTKDLDAVSEALFGLKTRGGSEYAGAVIRDAVAGLDWSRRNDVYKAIFIAGNEAFTQGPVPYREAAEAARAKGIFVNTIFCGGHQQGIATQWKDGAEAGGGDYLNIDQDRTVVAIRAPQDDEIERLGREMNKTFVPYGSRGRALSARQEAQDSFAAAAAPAGAAVQRSLFKANEQYSGSATWDAVTLVESGKKDVSELDEKALPEEIRSKGEAEKKKYFAEKISERRAIQEKIRKLSSERKAYVAEKEKERSRGEGTLTFDKAVIGAVRAQAATRDYSFKD